MEQMLCQNNKCKIFARLHSVTHFSLSKQNEGMDPSTALFNQLKAAEPFFLLAGPNVIESEEHIMRMAKHIKSISTKVGLPLVFKSSFDKANRTSSKSFRGPGIVEGLKILEKVKIAYDIPIVTDVHETVQCEEVGKVADIIQIPAFLCRQTDLLVAAAKTGKIINIKKGQFCASSVMVNSAEKVRLAGNPNVMVCERGTMFGYNDLIVDPRNLEWMREANCPVVADVTHSLQQPAGKKLDGGGVASGGLRELIPCIARTAVAVGVDGVFMEVHDDPLNAPVDGPTQWPLHNLEELLEELVAIAVKDLISISETYTRDHMLWMEKLMLKKLKFRLNVPTPYVFMLRFLKAAQSDTKVCGNFQNVLLLELEETGNFSRSKSSHFLYVPVKLNLSSEREENIRAAFTETG
ncbi:hypothetical protein WN944_025150 [Citrus x changshan-huyou]|uniref:3-deoxy-8-phosphooctulonate synthase n=1 Tax=Citrus x changshan-huyou TaxID=2935761 RepID=A0AAP0LQ68_9ROSI